MHHVFNDLAKPIKDKEMARYRTLRQEFFAYQMPNERFSFLI